jgi:hypothetical protein
MSITLSCHHDTRLAERLRFSAAPAVPLCQMIRAAFIPVIRVSHEENLLGRTRSLIFWNKLKCTDSQDYFLLSYQETYCLFKSFAYN